MDQSNSGTGATRRDFLKTSAAVAGAAAVTGGMFNGSVYAAGDDTVKIGLVGCGGRGTGAASQALSTSGSVKLVAVGDAFMDKAQGAVNGLKKQFKDRVEIPDDKVFAGWDAYKQVVDSGVDLVILATSPGFRPMHFEYAVAQGKNVFMEKPVATDAGGVRRVLAAAEEAKKKNLKVGVGLQRHHDPKYIETVKRLQDGELGDLILLRAYWNGDRPWVRGREALKKVKPDLTEMEYQMRNWYYFVWTCGDHINEQHIHNLDVINWVKKGPPKSAQGVGGRQVYNFPDQGEIFDHHMIEYTYGDGSVLLSECRHQPKVWNSVSEHAHGSKGYANIGSGSFDFKDGTKWKYKGANPNPYQVEHDDLFAAIRNNVAYSEAEYGAHSTMTAILGRMATYSGQQITWENAINSKVSVMPEKFAWDANPPSLPDPVTGMYAVPQPGKTKVV